MRYLLLLVPAIVMMFGCHHIGSLDGDVGPDTDADSDSDTDSDTDSDSDSDSDTDGDSDTICDDEDISIEVRPVRLVILQDFSGSMSPNWTQTTTAITNFLTLWTGGAIEFGFDYFPIDGNCGVNSTIAIAPAAGTETTIINWMTTHNPDGMTPLWAAMANYHNPSYAAGFPEPDTDSYLVVIVGSIPSCGGGTAATFTTMTAQLLVDQIKTFAIGFNYSSSAQLDAIAAAGGMPAPYNVPLIVTDSVTLQNAFSDIAQVTFTCIFNVQAPASADPDNINFYFDDAVVSHHDGRHGSGDDRLCVHAAHTQMEFCPVSCDDIKDGDPPDITPTWCPHYIP